MTNKQIVDEIQGIIWTIDEGPAHVKLTEAITRLVKVKDYFESLADEPAREKDGCFRCRNRPLPGASGELCKSCKLVIGKNYDPIPILATEPAREDKKCSNCIDWDESKGSCARNEVSPCCYGGCYNMNKFSRKEQ